MSRPSLPAAVLWDMDGTLVDSEHFWITSERKLAADHGREWRSEDGMALIGKSLYDSAAIIKERLDSKLSIEEIIDRLTDGVLEAMTHEIPWRPGAIELLSELKANGIKTALVTMSMQRMARRIVEQIGFEAFDVVLGGDDVEFGKPHPEPYLKAAALLGAEPGQCVAFEDSETGLASAEAAGTVAIGIPNFMPLAPSASRLVWPSLTGVTVAKLSELFE